MAYRTLEYNTFQFDIDLGRYALDPTIGRSADNLPYSRSETVLIHEVERSKTQTVLLPSLSFERRIYITNKLHLSLGLRISDYKGIVKYFYQGTWGFGGNRINQFDALETYVLESRDEYLGSKIAGYIVPEWKINNWTIGASFGLQYKRTTAMLHGTSVVHKRESIKRPSLFEFRQNEVGILTGVRLSHEVTFKKQNR